MGNQTSQWFALYYLDGLDRLAKEKYRIKYYTRYMDDCIMIHKDKEYLKKCLAGMKDYVEKDLLLEFNEKTQLTAIKNGVDYLGFHFYLSDTGKVIRRLRTRSKRRWKRRLKKFKHQYKEGEVDALCTGRQYRIPGSSDAINLKRVDRHFLFMVFSVVESCKGKCIPVLEAFLT